MSLDICSPEQTGVDMSNSTKDEAAKLIRQAAHLNSQGACLLVAGKPSEAFEAFNAAFDAIGTATIAIKNAERENDNGIPPSASSSDLSSRPKKPQESYISSIAVREDPIQPHHVSGDDFRHFVYNHAFLFEADDIHKANTNAHLSELFTAAVAFNMALSFHQRCEDSNPNITYVAQATSLNLYYMTMQLINECACEFDCRSLLVAALNNTATLYYDLNDIQKYEETQSILRCLLTDLIVSRPNTFEQTFMKGFLFNVTLLRRPFSAGAA